MAVVTSILKPMLVSVLLSLITFAYALPHKHHLRRQDDTANNGTSPEIEFIPAAPATADNSSLSPFKMSSSSASAWRPRTVKIIGRNKGPVNVFYGIPFSAPPVGNNRFRAPSPPTYPPVIDYDHSTPACMQGLPGYLVQTPYGISEDCLYLDIWVPANLARNAKVPVMVWSYGGGFMIGTSATSDFTNFIKRSGNMNAPVIVVAINYRLNSFGFGYGPAYLANKAANNGLLDVKYAIQWTYDYIGSFGGDCSRITAFGASSGGATSSLMAVITNPPPIAALISNSGRTGGNPLANTRYGFPDVFPLLLEKTGCTSQTNSDWSAAANDTAFECLRRVDAYALLDATVEIKGMGQFNAGFPWNPSVDGDVIKDSPNRLLRQGRYKKVPILAGGTLDEGTLFASRSTNSEQSVRDQVNWYEPRAIPPSTLNQLLQLYPADPSVGSPYGTRTNAFGLDPSYKRISSLLGDLGVHSSRRFLMEQNTRDGNPSIWTWVWSRHSPETVAAGLGTSHSTDTVFWLNTVSADTADIDTGGKTLSDTMATYWINFANYQNPNGNRNSKSGSSGNSGRYAVPNWPKYNAGGSGSARMLNLDGDTAGYTISTIKDDFRKEGIQFINDNPDVFNL